MIVIHRLVQAVTTAQMTPQAAARWRSAAAALAEAAIPAGPERPGSWPAYAALLPHAQAVLSPTSGGIWRIASYLGLSGATRPPGTCGRRSQKRTRRSTARSTWPRWRAGATSAPSPERRATRPPPGTCSLPCCPSASGCPAPITPTPWLIAPASLAGPGKRRPGRRQGHAHRAAAEHRPALGAEARAHPDRLGLACFTGRRATRPPPGTCSPRCCPTWSGYWAPRTGTPWPPALTSQPAPGKRATQLPPGHVRRAAAHAAAGPRRRAPGHPGRPRQPCSLDRGGGRPAAARDLHAALLPRLEKVLGAEHPSTRAARRSLAYWTGHTE